ncbi:hypothetical protein GC177_02785 [bacterium]|nr:hypothetical protein [bacterium]
MTAILNRSRLDEVTSGDKGLRATLTELYCQTLERCVTELKSIAHGGKNTDAWYNAAHELKGASGNVGAEEMADLCRRMEHAAPESWPEALEELEDATEAVQSAFHMLDE